MLILAVPARPRRYVAQRNLFRLQAASGGTLSATDFHVGAHATIASQHIIYNPISGFLFYDSDGSGAHAPVHFVTNQPTPRADPRRLPRRGVIDRSRQDALAPIDFGRAQRDQHSHNPTSPRLRPLRAPSHNCPHRGLRRSAHRVRSPVLGTRNSQLSSRPPRTALWRLLL